MSEPAPHRFARADDIGAVARMVVHSFPGTLRPPAWWEERLARPTWGGGPDTLLLHVERGRPVAACQIHPLAQWVAGARLPCAGIGSVAVSPAHRKRRLAGVLVEAALRAARDRGDVASALYPFRSSFYQRLGYGHAGDALQYQVPPRALPDSTERARVELVHDSAARQEVLALYRHWATTQTGQMERPDAHWRELCAVHDRVLVAYRAESAALEGYALATYRTDLPRRDRFLEVDELVWTTPRARRGLYGWLASLDDQWEQLLIRALPQHRLGDWLAEPRLPYDAAPNWGLWAPAATFMAGTMFRILDLPAAFAQRAVTTRAPLAVALEVTDPQIPENAGAWTFELDDDRAAIRRGADGRHDVTIRLDVSTLSRIFIGALAPSAALDAGLLECDAPARLATLDAAFKLPDPWTFDRF